MKYIAVSESPEEIEKLSQDTTFEKVSAETVYLINESTGSNIVIPEGDEMVNMCKGLEDYGKNKRAEGILETLVSLVQKGLLAVKDAPLRPKCHQRNFSRKCRKCEFVK